MRKILVDSARFLTIMFAVSWCGLLLADSRHTAVAASAVSRISLNILPRVEVERVHHVTLESSNEYSSVAHSDSLCLTSSGSTDYSVTIDGRTDIALRQLSGTDGNCTDDNSVAYGFDLPVDDASNKDFGKPLTVLVSAE